MEQDLRGLTDPDEKSAASPDCIGKSLEGFKEGNYTLVDP